MATGVSTTELWLLSMAVLWVTAHAATTLATKAYPPQQLSTMVPAASTLECICSINVSEGRSVECRQYEADSQDLLYLSKRNVLMRSASCESVTNLTVMQPKRILQLRPGRLLLMRNLVSLGLHQVGLAASFPPDALRGLVSLRELELVGPHSLTRLEAHSFQHTPSLRRLVLRDNGIEVIDRFAFCEADKLEHLDLSRNRIAAYSCDWFPGLVRLAFLNVTLLTGLQTEAAPEAAADPPDCLFCPLPRLTQLSFNAWDLDISQRAQALRYAVNRHYQLALQGPLLYNVTGLRDHGACGRVNSSNVGITAWQLCQRWRDGKPVLARYVTLQPTSSTTAAATAAVTTAATVTDVVSTLPTFQHTVDSNQATGANATAPVLPPTKTDSDLPLFLSSAEFFVVLAVGLGALCILLIASCIACCITRRRGGVRYSVKAANEAAATNGATNPGANGSARGDAL